MKQSWMAKLLLLAAVLPFEANASDVAIVGATQGKASVMPSGAASYSIPVVIPRSLGGVGPSLSINYSSQSQGGTAGMGWSLGGLEQITRCPKTVAQDGATVGITFTASDRFCLNGQRLVAISGAYGADQTEYRTEIDSGSRIISYGTAGNGPSYFKVWTKDGLTKEYGNTTSSRLMVNKTTSGTVGLTTTAQAWGLDKVTDRVTNYWTVSYQTDTGGGALFPAEIDYAGNTTANVTPANSVKFSYRTKPAGSQQNLQFVAGSQSLVNQDISFIDAYVGTKLSTEYRLAYQVDTGSLANGLQADKARLASIEECHYNGGATASCLDPVELVWSSDAKQGLPDFTPNKTANLSFGGINPNYFQSFVGDISGDGRADVAFANITGGTVRTVTQLASVTSPGQPAAFGVASYNQITGSYSVDSAYTASIAPTFTLADVNHDGKADLVMASLGASGFKVYTFLSNGNGTFAAGVATTINTVSLPAPTAAHPYSFAVTDVNGDGISDYAAIYADGSTATIRYALRDASGNVGAEHVSSFNTSTWVGATVQQATIADMNGDGIPDAVVVVKTASNDVGVYVSLGSASGAFSATPSATIAASASAINYGSLGSTGYSAHLVDVNRDGIPDVLVERTSNVSQSGQNVYYRDIFTALSRGDLSFDLMCPVTSPTFSSCTTSGVGQALQNESGAVASVSHWQVFFGDIDGDGSLDVINTGLDANYIPYMLLNFGVGNGLYYATLAAPMSANPVAASAGLTGYGVSGAQNDANADGTTDLIIPFIYQNTVDSNAVTTLVTSYTQENAAQTAFTSIVYQDKLASITTSAGAAGTGSNGTVQYFNYAALPSSSSVYTKGSGAVYPQIDTNMPLIVTASASSTLSGVTQTSSTYQYTGSRVDMSGRGLLGFAKVTATTTQTAASQTITTTDVASYRQDFPYIGSPVDSTHTVNSILGRETKSNVATGDTTCTSTPVTTVVNDFSCSTPYTGVYFPQMNHSTTSSYDPTAAASTLLSTTTDSKLYDAYGNLLQDISTTQNPVVAPATSPTFSATTTSTNAYFAPVTTASAWAVNLLKTQSVTAQRTVNGVTGPGISHSNAYTYDASYNLLTQTREPSVASLNVVTTYGRDSYGNVTSTQVSGAGDPAITKANTGITTRTSAAAYGACASGAPCAGSGPGYPAGVFKTSDTTPPDQAGISLTTSYIYDPFTGAQLSVTDPNGLIATKITDAIGRDTRDTGADGSYSTTAYNACATFASVGSGTTGCESGESQQVVTTPYGSNSLQSGAPSYRYLDALGREVRDATLAYDGTNYIISRKEYDAMGRLLRSSRPALTSLSYSNVQWSVPSYDAVGRTIKMVDPTGTVSTAYVGLTITQTNQINQQRVSTLTPTGETVSVVDAASNTLTYGLDDMGRVTSSTDPKGNQIKFTLDPYGNNLKQVDSDLGTSSYLYDVLGELVWRQDAREAATTPTATATTYAYDLLGRMVTQTEPDLISNWTYDTAVNGKGKLAKETGSNSYERDYVYDGFGRLSQDITKKAIDPKALATDPDFVYTTTYDTASRVSQQTYPSGFSYQNIYDANGYLQKVIDGRTQLAYWTAISRDAFGHVTGEQFGNGLATFRTYDTVTELEVGVTTGHSNTSGQLTDAFIQNDRYYFDNLGNLTTRDNYFGVSGSSTDPYSNVNESLTYDNLNRLTSATFWSSTNPGSGQTASYDQLGNISNRSDIGTYTYGTSGTTGCTGPHQVCTVGSGVLNTSFTYDANGNTLTGNGRSYGWTSFNMPSSIAQGATTDSFLYTPEHERVRQVSNANGQISTTVYINPRIDKGGTFEKDYLPDGSMQFVNTLYAGGQPIGSVAITSPAAGSNRQIWSTDLTTSVVPTATNPNSTNLTLTNSSISPALVYGAGSLGEAFNSYSLNGSVLYQDLLGQTLYATTQSLISQVVVKTSVNGNGTGGNAPRYLMVAERSNGVWGSTSSRFGIFFTGNQVWATWQNGTTSGSANIGSGVLDNTAYVVELDTGLGGNTAWVYPQGQPKSSGWSYTLPASVTFNWDYNGSGLKRGLQLETHTLNTTSTYNNITYVLNISESPQTKTHYFHTDHLGSITATSDDGGNLVERFAYDAWGRRRNLDGTGAANVLSWATAFTTTAPSTTNPNAAHMTLGNTGYSQLLSNTSTGEMFNAMAINGPVVYGDLVGQTTYTAGQSVVSQLAVNMATPSASGGTPYLLVSQLGNGSVNSQVGVVIQGSQASATWRNGSGATNSVVLTSNGLLAHTGYTVELDTGPTTNTVRVFRSGFNPTTGWSYSLPAGTINWDPNSSGQQRRLVLETASQNSTATFSNITTVRQAIEYTVNQQHTIVAQATDTDRGFTEHEMLDSVALIHMNGRVYDPQIGRFISADPNVFYPDNLQDFNRYSYVHNNPLSATDPSGFCDITDGYTNCGGGSNPFGSLSMLNLGFNLPGSTSSFNGVLASSGGINIPGPNNLGGITGFNLGITQLSTSQLSDAWGQLNGKRQLLCADICGGDGKGMEWSSSSDPIIAAQQNAIETAMNMKDYALEYQQSHMLDAAMASAMLQQSQYLLSAAARSIPSPSQQIFAPIQSIVADTTPLTASQQFAANKAAGAAFEQAVGSNLTQSGLTVGQQVTVETASGVKTRLDFITQDPITGAIGCIECKASSTAPLTPNQTLAFPEIGQSGGVIKGAGKPGFPGGMIIPPTQVQIIRGP